MNKLVWVATTAVGFLFWEIILQNIVRFILKAMIAASTVQSSIYTNIFYNATLSIDTCNNAQYKSPHSLSMMSYLAIIASNEPAPVDVICCTGIAYLHNLFLFIWIFSDFRGDHPD